MEQWILYEVTYQVGDKYGDIGGRALMHICPSYD